MNYVTQSKNFRLKIRKPPIRKTEQRTIHGRFYQVTFGVIIVPRISWGIATIAPTILLNICHRGCAPFEDGHSSKSRAPGKNTQQFMQFFWLFFHFSSSSRHFMLSSVISSLVTIYKWFNTMCCTIYIKGHANAALRDKPCDLRVTFNPREQLRPRWYRILPLLNSYSNYTGEIGSNIHDENLWTELHWKKFRDM